MFDELMMENCVLSFSIYPTILVVPFIFFKILRALTPTGEARGSRSAFAASLLCGLERVT